MTEVDGLQLNRDLMALEKRVAELESGQLVRNVQPWMKGMRTKIVGWLSSLPMITLGSGLTIDPQAAAELIQEHGLALAVAQIAMSAGVHYYRNQAGGPK